MTNEMEILVKEIIEEEFMEEIYEEIKIEAYYDNLDPDERLKIQRKMRERGKSQ